MILVLLIILVFLQCTQEGSLWRTNRVVSIHNILHNEIDIIPEYHHVYTVPC